MVKSGSGPVDTAFFSRCKKPVEGQFIIQKKDPFLSYEYTFETTALY